MRTFERIRKFHRDNTLKALDDPRFADFYVRTIEESKQELLEDVKSNEEERYKAHEILDDCEFVKRIAYFKKKGLIKH